MFPEFQDVFNLHILYFIISRVRDEKVREERRLRREQAKKEREKRKKEREKGWAEIKAKYGDRSRTQQNGKYSATKSRQWRG